MKVEPINEQQQYITSQQPQTQTKDYIELDLDSLIKLGVIEREVEVYGKKFTLRTLTEEERQIVEQESNDGLPIDDPKHILNTKIPTLSFAIIKIDGKPILPENRERLKQVLRKMQGYILDKLFMKYMELIKDQFDLVELGLKKNGQ